MGVMSVTASEFGSTAFRPVVRVTLHHLCCTFLDRRGRASSFRSASHRSKPVVSPADSWTVITDEVVTGDLGEEIHIENRGLPTNSSATGVLIAMGDRSCNNFSPQRSTPI